MVWDVRGSDDQLIDSGDKVLPDLGPDQKVEVSWAVPSSRSLTLSVRLVCPTGFVAAEKKLLWWDPRSGGLDVDTMRKEGEVSSPRELGLRVERSYR